MARARNIKPAFFSNDELGELDPLARLLFVGMWTVADYKGCFEYRAKRLKAQLLPYDNCDVEKLTKNLEQSGFIQFYSVQGKQYIKVVNFEKHQNPHKNEKDKDSEIPDISEADEESEKKCIKINDRANIENNHEDYASDRADSLLLIPDSLNLIPDSPNPEIGVSGEKTKEELFEKFWSEYPNKKSGLKKAKDSFFKIDFKKHSFEKIMQSLGEHKQSHDWLKDQGKYVPHATTWLNQERWTAVLDQPHQNQHHNRPQTAQERIKQENAEYWAKRAKRYEQQSTEQSNVIDVTPKKTWVTEEVRHVS